MGKIETKLLLAYVNTYRPITNFDKELHRDFFSFNILIQDESGSQLDMEFELVNDHKGKVIFEDEPFCHELEMLMLKLIAENKLAFVEAGSIDITQEGYEELVKLRRTVEASIPSVRYMLTRIRDQKYQELYRKTIEKMKEQQRV